MLYVICGKKRSGKSEAGNIILDNVDMDVMALGNYVKQVLEEAGRNHKFREKGTFWTGDRDFGPLLLNNDDVYTMFVEGVKLIKTRGYGEIVDDKAWLDIVHQIRRNEIPWTSRRLMQMFATDVVCNCISPTVWTRMLLSDLLINGKSVDTLITDCRQEHEYKYFRSLGAKFIFIERDTGLNDPHSTEQGLTPQQGDVVILNNGTLDELKSQILKHIKPSV